MKKIFSDALMIITAMESEKLPVRLFLGHNADFFTAMDRRSLIPPECREYDRYSETSYVFLIGSYLYQRIEGKPVTWLERRRFASYDHYPELFSRTLCSYPKRRFQSINELKAYLTEVMQNEKTN